MYIHTHPHPYTPTYTPTHLHTCIHSNIHTENNIQSCTDLVKIYFYTSCAHQSWTYSGGMSVKVMLCKAMLNDLPRLALFIKKTYSFLKTY